MSNFEVTQRISFLYYLSKITDTGEIVEVYNLASIYRPSALSFKDDSLWVLGFNGSLYEVPLVKM